MTPVPPHTLSDALHWRYATQKFDPAKSISADVWQALEHALILTPSSFGLQPWKFVVVRDPELRQKLSAAAWGQKQPLECSHFVVFAVHRDVGPAHVDRHFDRVAEVRGAHRDTFQKYRDRIIRSADKARQSGQLDTWMSHQVYIALGQFIASAAVLGVDTCPMEGLDPAKYDEILGLTGQSFGTLCACAAGYRAADDPDAAIPKVRFKASDVISHR